METASAVDSYLAQTDTDNLCLTFRLGDQDYGIAISKVQEIREWTKVTPLPSSPPYIRGMLNLRGAIVPVIDLRLQPRRFRKEAGQVGFVGAIQDAPRNVR